MPNKNNWKDSKNNNSSIHFHKTITQLKRPKPTFESLGFGKHFTDHMLICEFKDNSWLEPKIMPYQNFSLEPSASVLHYGQALFEGMKAFYQSQGNTEKFVLFRPEFNWRRFNQSAERLCMPKIPKEIFIEGIKELVRLDSDWIPRHPSGALYIRPTLIGTEGFLGVRPSQEYLFFTILSPVGPYYGSDTHTGVRIWIEEDFVRAAPGGLGATKAAANYANSLFATQIAKQKGFAQVLWLDVFHKNIEEVGTMNVFFVIDGIVVTPDLHGTILSGGVRDSVIQLLRDWNYTVESRPLSLDELTQAYKSKKLTEVFGTGTAAVITAVDELHRKSGEPILLPQKGLGPVSLKLFNTLNGIQRGTIPDSHFWVEEI